LFQRDDGFHKNETVYLLKERERELIVFISRISS